MNQLPEIPKGNQESINRFWEALINAGREVLAEGLRLGYGYSIVEVKYAGGSPSVLIRSHTQNRKYKTTAAAHADIQAIIERTKEPGSQTLTIIREANGTISRVMLDEYLNTRLQ